ncbi:MULTISPECIES: ABC transporter substrate-binding protein [Corynebacterium]|uniref:ABC transporter substrate-binding protein n=1 Tax=Corynebacterium TaxID=1716 RepID=UPI00124C4AB5|nr:MULTISPECIES: ABC transporter substrate-binding protein [Corynebacterium]
MNLPSRRSRRDRTGLRTAALATALAVGVSGCSAGSTAVQVGRVAGTHDIVVAASASPVSLDFTTNSGAAIPGALMSNVYETLVRIDDDGQIVPWLATSWEVSEDGRRYTFTLRDDVTFSNGDAFTAETVKFSIDRVRSEAWSNGLKKKMDIVESVEVLSPTDVSVQLAASSNQWLWDMATLVGAMMTPSAMDTLASAPVGTGPYEVENFAIGHSISFRARDDYWGPAPQNQGAAIRYFADAVAAMNALRSGDVDVVYSMQSPELLHTFDPTRYTVEVGTTNGEVLLSMNNNRAPFDDVRVRQAVMYGIDRQAVIDTAWDGHGIDTGGAPVPPTDPWYEASTRYPFDPERARQLLAEAGINESNNHVVFSVPSLPYAVAASEIVVSQLRDIGLDVSIRSTEFPAVWLNEVLKQQDYDMSLVMHIEPRDIPQLFGNPEYYLGFDSPEVRALLEKADRGTAQEQVRYMKKAVDQIMAEAGADTLFNFPNIVVTDRSVSGVRADQITEGLELATMHRAPDDGESGKERS